MQDKSVTSGRRARGVVVRWGTRGYGFISSPELPREAWCHVRFIEDPGIDVAHPLHAGMELEFEPREVEGGKIQALAVTRLGVRPAAPSSTSFGFRSSIRGLDRLASLNIPAPLPLPAEAVTPPQPETVREPTANRGLGARVSGERRQIESERTRLESEAQRLQRRAEATEAQLPDVVRDFDEKIAELQREKERQVSELRQDADKYRRQADAVRARRDSLPSASDESIKILSEHLRCARADLAARLESQADAQGKILRVRRAAVEAVGEQAVSDYEEIRRRRALAADGVEAKAYALAESACRAAVSQYADMLDRSSGSSPARLDVVVLVPDDPEGRLVLVVPVAPDDIERDDKMLWRIGAFVFDAAERAAREMDAAVTVGETAGCLAVNLRPWAAEPELVEVALQEAWEARPSLVSALSLAREIVPGVDPPFRAIELDSDAGARPIGPAMGGDVRTVANRLGLHLADLIAGLRGSGLPFPDDSMEPGVEESLRRLLDVGAEDEPSSEVHLAEPGPSAQSPDRSSPPMVAQRILAKLLRDHRIAGRHTEVENAWGHHFADDEKDLAREITRRLIRRGILLLKAKPGGDHISIDPRRIAEVHKIVDLRCPEPSLFEGLD